MPLTPEQISQLPVFNNIASIVPQGTFDLVAKSPLLVAELQSYSAEISNNTRGAILFLADVNGAASGAQFNSQLPLPAVQIGNQYLSSATNFVAALAHEIAHEQNAATDQAAFQNATNAQSYAQVCEGEEGIAIANNYLVATQILQNGGASAIPVLGMNQQMAANFSAIQQAYEGQGVAAMSSAAASLPTGDYLTTLSAAAATANLSNLTSTTGQTYLQFCQSWASKAFPAGQPTSPGPAGLPSEKISQNADGSESWAITEQTNGVTIATHQVGAGQETTMVSNASGQPLSSAVNGPDGASMLVTYSYGASGSLTGETLQSLASNTVQFVNATNKPEGTVNVAFNGSNSTANVTVTDSAGHTQTYTMSGTPGIEDAIDSSAAASGAGPFVLIGGDNATLSGGGGQNLLIELGKNDTAIAGSGATQIVVGGLNDYVTGSGASITTLTNASFNLSGNNDTIILGANSYAGLLGGSGNVVNNDVAGDTVNLASNAAATINGSGGYLGICGTNVSVNASNESVGTIAGASFNLSGSNDTITLGANSYAGLLGGSGNVVNNDVAGDTVNLTSGAAATINGSGGYIGICGTNIWVNASNESIVTIPGASFNLSGGNDGVTLGANSYLGLLGGSGYMVWGSGDTIDTWANTSLNLQGSNDTVSLGGTGDYLGLLGGSGYTVYGSGDTINTWANTSLNLQGNNDTIGLGGSGDYLGLLGGSGYMVYGSGDTINTWANTSLNLQGNNDTIGLGGTGDYLGLLGGSGYTVYGSGDTISTWANTSLNLQGSNDGVYLGGTGDYLGLLGGSGYMVYGTGDTIATWDNTGVNLQGSNDTVSLGAGDTLGLLSGSGYTVYGSGDTIWTWGGTSFNLGGNNDTIYLGTSNFLNLLAGSGDAVNGIAVGSGGSGVSETVTTNPDGSWVDHLVDTGNQFGWTEEQFVHAANNGLAEETINYDNGWHVVSYFDAYNQFTWAQQTKTYNAQGKIASWTYDHQAGEVVTNDDGSVATTYYGADGANVNEVQVSIPGGGSAQYWVNRVNPGNNAYSGNASWFQSADWTGGPSGGGFGDVGVTDLYFDPFTGYFDPSAIADDGLSYFPLDAVDDDSDFEIFVDPLVLNLAGGKVTTTARGESGIAFDMRGDGGQQSTGWITLDEGFLVVDKEHTGRITSSHDMVSDLNELASFDDNHDGAITAADGRFGDLRVWVPDDKGGAGRLETLAQLGIAGIDLTRAAVAGQADHGNRINSTFQFSYADGTSGEGADVSFLTGTDALLHAMASFAPAAPAAANLPPAPPPPEYALAAAH